VNRGAQKGEWVELQPLGTEGQGASESGKSKYSRIQLAIPIGFGFKYNFDRSWGIQLQYGIRKTFTDYIDDVSTVYYDREDLVASNGTLAAIMADKSTGEFDYITEVGEQRGDSSNKDTYMFAVLSIVYKFRGGRSSYPLF
jgi:hypothetical protein